MLNNQRGFYTTNDRNYGYVGTRGFGRPSDYNTRLLLLENGHRMNENVYNSFLSGVGTQLDMSIIDRIEIVRSPGSALYGTNAFFGVINIITKRGRDFQGGEVIGEYGSYEQYKTAFNYGRRLIEQDIEFMISGSVFGRDGQTWYYPEFDDPSTNHGKSEDNDGTRKHTIFSQLSYKDFTLQANYNNRETEIPTASYGTVFNASGTQTTDSSWYVDLKYEHTFDSGGTLLARTSYNEYEYSGDYIYDYSETDEPWFVINKDHALGQWWMGELQWNQRLFEHHKVLAGANFQYNFTQNQHNEDVEIYLDDKRQTERWGIFVQDEIQLTDQWVLHLALHYDKPEVVDEQLSERAALIYKPGESTSIKLMYGRSFRAPNSYELYYGDTYTQIAPHQLDPETISSYEAVLEHTFNHKLRFSLSVFYNEIRDLIDQTTDPISELTILQNVGNAEAYGFETEVEGKLTQWNLKGKVSYSFQSSQDSNHQELSNSPQHMIKLNLDKSFWNDALIVATELHYMSARNTIKAQVGDNIIHNLSLSSYNLIPGAKLTSSLYNVFDKKFKDPGSIEHTQDAIQQNGRQFRLQLSYQF